MLFKKILPGLLFIIGIIPSAAAGEEFQEYTLEKAVQTSLENNLNLKSTRLDLESANRGKKSRWNSLLPTLSGSSELRYSDKLFSDSSSGYSTDPWTLSFGLSASLRINGASFISMEETLLAYEEGQLTYNQAKKELTRDIQKAFYNLLTQKTNLELLKSNLELAEQSYQWTSQKFENGLVPQVEVLKSRVTWEQLKPAFSKAQAAYENSLMNFKLLLGIPYNTPITINGELSGENYPLNAEELINRFTHTREDLRIIQNRIKQIQTSRVSVISTGMSPTLTLSPGWSTSVNNPDSPESWSSDSFSDNFTFSLGLSIPLDGLIPGSSTHTAIKDLETTMEKLQLSYELAYQNSCIEITNTINDIQVSWESYTAYKLNENLAEESYRLTRQAYRNGTRNLLEMESSQTDLLKARQELLGELYNYLCAWLDLEYTLNTPKAQIIETSRERSNEK